VDIETIENYDQNAVQIGELHAGLIPERLYELLKRYFIVSGATADIGCGIGRDTFWLSQHSFTVTGYDASKGMLSEAKRRYPGIPFVHAALPDLHGIAVGSFDNILCSAVLMHLPPASVSEAAASLARVARTSGVIILSLRGTTAPDHRESGKLYSPVDLSNLSNLFFQQGIHEIYSEITIEPGRNHAWHTLVFRKSSHLVL
jgi:SAM-dependent methyltransferase